MGEAVDLGPVRGRARIDVLDIMRGIAILGILFMNIPYMATNSSVWMHDIRRLSWTPIDQATWIAINVTWDGTQRGLFEFLFGAGALVLTAKAMRPDDPVAVADLFYRRNLWLIAFGLIDIFVIGWIGDILLIYGLSALLIFPFRKAPPRVLFAMGLMWATVCAVGWSHGGGVVGYIERGEEIRAAQQIETKKASGVKLTKDDSKKLEDWQKRRDALDLTKPPSNKDKEIINAETKARQQSGPAGYLVWSWGIWNEFFGDGNGTFFSVLEAVCGMFIGMALFKWGVIQGHKSKRFYLLLALCSYAVGFSLRGWAIARGLRFDLAPNPGMISHEFARLAVTLGHVGLFNLLAKTELGRVLLSPFKAAGRMAFSIYVGTSLATLWFVFAPWGLGLWNHFGWAGLAASALVIDAAMLVVANLWLRWFACGPLEWLWRSLAYWKRQPFLRATPAAPGLALSALPT